MSELKATPGPWVAYHDINDSLFYIAQQDGAKYTPDYSDVCGLRCHTWSGERHAIQKANAHLIAAAPELYEALEEALESLENVWESEGHYTDQKSIDSIKSALAKARGES